MKKIFFSIVLVVFVLGFYFINFTFPDRNPKLAEIANIPGSSSDSLATLKPELDFGKFPLYFIANKGQVNGKAEFYAKASGYTLWLTKEGLVFDSIRRSENPKSETRNAKQIQNSNFQNSKQKQDRLTAHELTYLPTHQLTDSSTPCERDFSRLLFVGANKNPEISAIEEAKLKVNYFIGNDKSKWHGDVPTAAAVLYKNIYENIDLKVYGIEKQIEYDWIVRPGGNPEDIKFLYKDVKGTRIQNQGDLLIETEFGELVHKKPISYQESKAKSALTHPAPVGKKEERCFWSRSPQSPTVICERFPSVGGESCVGAQRAVPEKVSHTKGTVKEKKIPVDVKFKKIATNTYGFAAGDYDKSRELVIDPVVLVYSTYLGGGGSEYGGVIAVDSSGYVYVTGRTDSSDFPILNQYQSNQASRDVFVTKIDTARSGIDSLIYSTYLGGVATEEGRGISVDNSGYVYVTGYTYSPDFPILNQYQTYQGSSDVFITKLDTNQTGTSSLIYSTCLGGTGVDYAQGIGADDSGRAYVTGCTKSPNFPTLNQYQLYQGGGWDRSDAFIAKIDTNQDGIPSLVYSTYLGGSSVDYAFGIAADDSGYVYVTGITGSEDFPIRNQFQSVLDGWRDTFVTKIDTTQSGDSCLIYSTYLGGSGAESGMDIAVDNNECAYITGYTKSWNFPTHNQYQLNPGPGKDVFVTKIDTVRSGIDSLIYSTYLGGMDYDEGRGIALDSSRYVYITGTTSSTDFPILNQYQADQPHSDSFVSKIDPTQSGYESLIYSTYLGGTEGDLGTGIAVGCNGNAYVTGYTYSEDFPIMNQYQANQEKTDAFVTKLTFLQLTVTSPNGGERLKVGSTHYITWDSSGVSGDLRINLLQDGAGVGIIANDVDPAVGYYAWTAGQYIGGTAAPGSGYKIKIREKGAATADTSDAAFNFSELTVTSPNGGENWYSGTIENITWDFAGISGNLKITLWQEEVSIGVIANDVSPDIDSYNWPVGQLIGGTAPAGTGYIIKIKEQGAHISDDSDDAFTISSPITVTSPNGGESWQVGTPQDIQWQVTSAVTGHLKITLWKDGICLGIISDRVEPTAGTFPWTAGQYSGGTAAPGSGYTIKIKEKGAPVSDSSNGPFSLAGPG